MPVQQAPDAVQEEPTVVGVPCLTHNYGEDEDWLNAKPSGLLAAGMPAGWEARLADREFGAGLLVSLLGREDLVATKLYALTDQSPTSKHAGDLLALSPSPDELAAAPPCIQRRWWCSPRR